MKVGLDADLTELIVKAVKEALAGRQLGNGSSQIVVARVEQAERAQARNGASPDSKAAIELIREALAEAGDLPEQYLTKRQVATLLQVQLRTVDALMLAGRLPFFRLNARLVRFRRKDIQAHFDARFRVH